MMPGEHDLELNRMNKTAEMLREKQNKNAFNANLGQVAGEAFDERDKPKFHLACHVMSRHDTLPSQCILA